MSKATEMYDGETHPTVIWTAQIHVQRVYIIYSIERQFFKKPNVWLHEVKGAYTALLMFCKDHTWFSFTVTIRISSCKCSRVCVCVCENTDGHISFYMTLQQSARQRTANVKLSKAGLSTPAGLMSTGFRSFLSFQLAVHPDLAKPSQCDSLANQWLKLNTKCWNTETEQTCSMPVYPID